MSQFEFIAPPHTPFQADGSLHLDVVAHQARHFAAMGVGGVFVGGSTGECQSLTVDERLRLAERWVREARPLGLRVIVQVGQNCQADAQRMACHAGDIGADAIAAHAPSYFKPATTADLIDFCEPIAGEVPQLPFYFYDIPSMTHVALPMCDFLQQGAERIPNLRGLKYTNGDLFQFQQVVRLSDARFEILFGCDEFMLAGYVLGAGGAVGTSYNYAAPLFQQALAAADRGDLPAAREFQGRAVEMIGVLREFGFAAASKAVMQIVGIDCGPVRAPLKALSSSEIAQLRERLESLGLLGELLPLASDAATLQK